MSEPISEGELKEMEQAAGPDPWWSDGDMVLSGAHEADIGVIASAAGVDNAKLIAKLPRLIAEVRRLCKQIEESGQPCENPSCDGVMPKTDCPHPHRCFKDGRWLDTNEEM